MIVELKIFLINFKNHANIYLNPVINHLKLSKINVKKFINFINKIFEFLIDNNSNIDNNFK
jgi:hypothetical protein